VVVQLSKGEGRIKIYQTIPQNVTFIINLFYGSEKDFTSHILLPWLSLDNAYK